MQIRMLLAGAVMALSASVSAGAVELVTNGSFETGDFTGWELFNFTGHSQTFMSVRTADAGQPAPTDGLYEGRFGPTGGRAGILQLLTTVVGRTYQLTFDVAGGQCGTAGCGGGVTEFSSFFDVGPGSGLGAQRYDFAFPYTSYSFTGVATSTSTLLSFSFRHDPWFYYLDNVSVTAVRGPGGGIPEPSAWALMILGFGVVGTLARRRAKLLTA